MVNLKKVLPVVLLFYFPYAMLAEDVDDAKEEKRKRAPDGVTQCSS
jgi:hypothetical protein